MTEFILQHPYAFTIIVIAGFISICDIVETLKGVKEKDERSDVG